MPAELKSPRLTYHRLSRSNVEAFAALARDAHVRRFLLDGKLVDDAWAENELAQSDALFASNGVGMWLVSEQAATALIGFCGFRVFPEVEPPPELLYALTQAYAGRGYATEMATALLEAGKSASMSPLHAAVDAPNTASVRVLEKVGFKRCGSVPGAFGEIFLYETTA